MERASNDTRPAKKVLVVRPRLVSLDLIGLELELIKDVILIGRDSECDLRLDDKSVSSLHCVLFRQQSFVLIRDLRSTNGTKVNGNRIRRATIAAGDMIQIAKMSFKLQFGPIQGEDALKSDDLPDIYPDSKLTPPSTRKTRPPETGRVARPARADSIDLEREEDSDDFEI